jgi:hypothetical protein
MRGGKMMTSKYIFIGMSVILLASIFLAGCVGTEEIIEEKILYNQTIMNKFQGRVGIGFQYNDCVVVLQDYSQYRFWYADSDSGDSACNKLPVGKNLTLYLTKFRTSQGRYDITSYEPKYPCGECQCDCSGKFQMACDC